MVKVFSDDVLYVESINRKINIVTLKSNYIIANIKFNDFIVKFDKNFILTHRTCLVNLKYIFKVNKNSIVLDNDSILPLSRYRINEVMSSFLNFVH